MQKDREENERERQERKGIQAPVQELGIMMPLITKQQHSHYQPWGHSGVAGLISRLSMGSFRGGRVDLASPHFRGGGAIDNDSGKSDGGQTPGPRSIKAVTHRATLHRKAEDSLGKHETEKTDPNTAGQC